MPNFRRKLSHLTQYRFFPCKIVAYHAVRMRQITLGHITHASNNTVAYHAGTEISEGIICQDMEFLRTNMSGYGIFLEEK